MVMRIERLKDEFISNGLDTDYQKLQAWIHDGKMSKLMICKKKCINNMYDKLKRQNCGNGRTNCGKFERSLIKDMDYRKIKRKFCWWDGRFGRWMFLKNLRYILWKIIIIRKEGLYKKEEKSALPGKWINDTKYFQSLINF